MLLRMRNTAGGSASTIERCSRVLLRRKRVPPNLLMTPFRHHRYLGEPHSPRNPNPSDSRKGRPINTITHSLHLHGVTMCWPAFFLSVRENRSPVRPRKSSHRNFQRTPASKSSTTEEASARRLSIRPRSLAVCTHPPS